MSPQRRAAPGTDPQPRPSGLDLPGLDWASVSREADIAHLGLPWGVRGTRRRKCFHSAWRGAGAPRGDGDPAHGQAVWGPGLEPPVSGLNSVHGAENRGVWPTVSTRISCGYRSGAARSKPRSRGVVRGVKPGGRKESPRDLGSEAFSPPGRVHVLFPLPGCRSLRFCQTSFRCPSGSQIRRCRRREPRPVCWREPRLCEL